MAPFLHEMLSLQKCAFFKLDPPCRNELEEQMEREDNQGLCLEIHLISCNPCPGKI